MVAPCRKDRHRREGRPKSAPTESCTSRPLPEHGGGSRTTAARCARERASRPTFGLLAGKIPSVCRTPHSAEDCSGIVTSVFLGKGILHEDRCRLRRTRYSRGCGHLLELCLLHHAKRRRHRLQQRAEHGAHSARAGLHPAANGRRCPHSPSIHPRGPRGLGRSGHRGRHLQRRVPPRGGGSVPLPHAHG